MVNEDMLIIRKEESICTLEINRPEKLNAMTPELYSELVQALRSVGEDRQTRVVILRGAGEKAFSTGHDISVLNPSKNPDIKDPLEDVITAVEDCAVPVIAMIFGYCVAAGCGLAAACDLRLAADNAHLGITAARLGVVYPASAIRRVINIVGVSAAKELLYTGKLIDAERAGDIRLVDRVVPADRLTVVTYDLAREIASNSPLTVKSTKRMISRLLSYQAPGPQARAEFSSLQKQAAASKDFEEGKKAFAERRKPVFKGE